MQKFPNGVNSFTQILIIQGVRDEDDNPERAKAKKENWEKSREREREKKQEEGRGFGVNENQTLFSTQKPREQRRLSLKIFA